MRSGIIAIGALMILAGAVFAGQGLGYIPGSFMTGEMTWFWIGSVLVVAGLAIGLAGLRSGAPRR
jgi:hypothetical protein